MNYWAYILILVAGIFASYAQDKIPSSQLTQAILNLKLPDEKTELELKREKAWREQFDRYIDGLKKEAKPQGVALQDNDLFRQYQVRQQLANCLTSLSNTVTGQFFNSAKGTFEECEKRFDASKIANWVSLKSMGIETPNDFLDRMEKENKSFQEQAQKIARPDKITIENLMRFDESTPVETTESVLDHEAITLATDVTSILLELHRSQNLEDYLESNTEGEGIADLSELAWMLSLVEDKKNPCRTQLGFKELASDDPEFKSILISPQGIDKDGVAHSPLQLFLGVNDERGNSKISAYQWVNEGKTHYLFHAGRFGETSDRWVLAVTDPATGKMELKHFQVVRSQDVLEASKKNDSRFVLQGQNNELDAQFGLNVETRVTRLPWKKNLLLPTGSVQLGQVSFLHHGKNISSLYNLNLGVDQIQTTANFIPRSGSWSTQLGATYNTFDNRVKLTSDVRVWNLTVGASTNLAGRDQIKVGLVLGRSYLNYQTDFKQQEVFTAGTQFGKKRQGAAAWSWQPKTGQQEVTVVIFLR